MKRERLHFGVMIRDRLAHIGRMSKWALPMLSAEHRKRYKDSISFYRKMLREARDGDDTEAAVYWALELDFSFQMLLREAHDMPSLRKSANVPIANAARAVVTDEQVVSSLKRNKGNVSVAADELGITRQAIYKRQSNWIQGTREDLKGDNSSGVVTRKSKRR